MSSMHRFVSICYLGLTEVGMAVIVQMYASGLGVTECYEGSRNVGWVTNHVLPKIH